MRPRRRHERFVRRLETEFASEGKIYRAISSDFSRYGLFIRTNHAFVPGTELDIVVHLPDGGLCRLKGIVRRAIKTPIVSLKNGMGIELTERDQNYRNFLKEFDPSEAKEPGHGELHRNTGHHSKPASDHAPEFVIMTCLQCGTKNKAHRERLSCGPRCGKCGSPLSPQP